MVRAARNAQHHSFPNKVRATRKVEPAATFHPLKAILSVQG